MIIVTGGAVINNGGEVIILGFSDGCSTTITSASIVRRIHTTEENIGS